MDIKDMSSADLHHSLVIDNFVGAVRESLKSSTCKVLSSQYSYKWTETGDKIFIPDASIICSFKRHSHNIIHETPRMVLEVLSPSTEMYDRNEKLEAYSKAGVGEVWLVDWRKGIVEIYVTDADKPYLYATITSDNKEELKLVNFPVTKIYYDDLFNMDLFD